jgi:hypothetical protein
MMFVGPDRTSDHFAVRVPSTLLSTAGLRRSRRKQWVIRMQKAQLYEAILLLNRGVDEAVRGLERLKRAKYAPFDSACFDEELALFEDHRARLNSYFCDAVQRSEQQDSARFEAWHREYERDTLDEVQVYRDVRVLEDRRRAEGNRHEAHPFPRTLGFEPGV